MESRFNILAQEWDSKPERVESAMNFVDYIKNTIDEDIKRFNIMDYGCGSGLVSFGFATDVKSIVGLDYSDGMVNRYNEKVENLNFNHVKAQKHNINEEDIKINQYDLVATNMTMHHIKDITNFIKVLKGSLTEGGYLFIADLVTEDGKFHSTGNEGVEHLGFEKEFLIEEFKKANFQDIKYEIVQTVEKDYGSYPIFTISGKR